MAKASWWRKMACAALLVVGEAAGLSAASVMLQPADVSDAIAWLVSDRAKYITGVQLPVDAGFMIR